MDKKFLIDTNIIIYYHDGKIPADHVDKVSEIFCKSFLISTITKIEVLGWHKLTGLNKEKLMSFMESAQVIYVDQEIEQKAIELKQNFKMASPDAIISATALVYNLSLLTRNEKDFEQIKALEIYNPFKDKE